MELNAKGFLVSIVFLQCLHLITVAQVALNISGVRKIPKNPKKIKNESVAIKEKNVASTFSIPSDSSLQYWHL